MIESTITEDQCGVLEAPHNWEQVTHYDIDLDFRAGFCVLLWQREEFSCDPQRYVWAGDSFSWDQEGGFEGPDGCYYRWDREWTVGFTESATVASQILLTYSTTSGPDCTHFNQNPCEIRYNETQQEKKDTRPHYGHEDRINKSRLESSLQGLLVFSEIRQSFKNHVKGSGSLSGPYHIDIYI